MRTADVESVKSHILLAGLPADRLETLLVSSFLQTFPPHAQLILEGDQPDFLFAVIDGRAELKASWNSQETAMSFVDAGGSFILAAVLRNAACLMSARTAERSRILMIPGESVRIAFDTDDVFARAVVLEMAGAYRRTVMTLKDLKLRTGIERLAARLMQMNVETGNQGRFRLPYDKRTLAALLNMTPEHLSRAFANLKPYGVNLDGSEVRLLTPGELALLAKPDPLIDGGAL